MTTTIEAGAAAGFARPGRRRTARYPGFPAGPATPPTPCRTPRSRPACGGSRCARSTCRSGAARLALAGVVLVGGPLMVGVVPAVRQIEGAAVQTLLVVQFRDGPPGPALTWSQRRRTLGWLLLHLMTGSLVVASVIGLIA